MHTPSSSFGNLDTIFFGDPYQAQPILDSIVFENRTTEKELMFYNF